MRAWVAMAKKAKKAKKAKAAALGKKAKLGGRVTDWMKPPTKASKKK